MKKTKFLSLALACLMIVGMIPFGVFSISAETTTTTIPTMPTTLPNGNIGRTAVLADFGEGITGTTNATNNEVKDGKWVSHSTDASSWASGSLSAKNTIGAAGLMFYVEPSDQEKTAEFILGFNCSMGRDGDVRFDSTVNCWGNGMVYADGVTCTYYTYGANGWTEHVQRGGTSYYIGTKGSAWYYIPFTSFIYNENGTGGVLKDNSTGTISDDAYGLSYAYFMEHYVNAVNGIGNIRIKSNKNTGMDIAFNDIYMVYPEKEAASENAAISELMPGGDIIVKNQEGKNDNWSASVDNNGVLTISGTTGNNVTTVSDKRVWVGSSVATRDMTKADGIRFYVDSSSLGNTTQLLLRIRLKDTVSPQNVTEAYSLLTLNKNGTKDLSTISGGNIQYLLRSAGSTAYVYNEAGNLVPCYAQDGLLTANNTHGDAIALPAGYKGYVYIPMDSFYACLGGSWGNNPLVSFDTAVSLGLAKTIDQICLIQAYSDDANAADYSVSYSDFQVVYDGDLAVTKTAAAVGNDLALKALVTAEEGVTVESASYTLNSKTYQATLKSSTAGTEVICDGILPQDAGKDVTITVKGKQGNNTLTVTVTTSVKNYCLKLIADASASAEAKNVAADLLRYANAAQVFAAGGVLNVTSPIVDNTTSSAIAALGTNAVFSSLNLTDNSQKSATTLAGYDMTGAALRLENALALKLFVTVPSDNTKTVKASFKVGENEAVEVAVQDGVAVFGGIGAAEMATAITVTLTVDGTAVQTLTYTINNYFANALADTNLTEEEEDLVKALYNYGVSASAYAGTLQ